MLNMRRALDPRWSRHHKSVPEGFMIHPVIIYRMDGTTPSMDPVTGEITGGDLLTIWTGDARIQPNKDWRARFVESASDPQMVHYTRVQIPAPTLTPPPSFRVGDLVVAQEVEDTEDWTFNHDLSAWTMFVRNVQNSSNRWLVNLLCAADLSDQIGGTSP